VDCCKKRGQVTVFIIVGLALLLLVSLVLVFRSSQNPDITPEPIEDPIVGYVEQCLLDVTEEGVRLIGLQGGYIDLDIDAIKSQFDPFNSPALSLAEGRLFIPYWLYQDSGLDNSMKPTLHKSYDGDYSIQTQLETYLADNLRDCIDLDFFDSMGMNVIDLGVLEPRVVIGEDSVNVKLYYPLEVHLGEEIETKADYFAELPVRLGRVFGMAEEILQYELDTLFLERNTMNLISYYSRTDSEYLPPMYGGMEFKPCSERVFWIYPDVYDDVKDVLMANMAYLKIQGSDFSPVIVADSDEERRKMRQGIFANMVHDVGVPQPELQVNFEHLPSFPMELDFGSQGVLEPNSFQMSLVFAQVCMFEYKFGYNLRYPVLITITDPESNLQNRDFLFQFPVQVVLKNCES